MVNYYFDTFEHLNSFDILPYQEVVDLYLKNQSLLEENKFEKLGGDNERPINSDVEKVDHQGFWHGFPPRYYNIDPMGKKVSIAKADVVSMDMVGLGKTWSHFVYLELPYEFFNQYQTRVHSNDNVSIYKKFLNELGSEADTEKVQKLIDKYDELYPELYSFKNYFRVVTDLKWRQDLEVGQYMSIRDNGIIYPICFNSMTHIFKRGTHRSLFLAHTKSDVPIFIQYPKLNAEKIDFIWEVNLGSHLSNIVMRVDMDNKKLKFFKEVL